MHENAGDRNTGTNVIGSIREKRIYTRTFGCTYNMGDTLKLQEVLKHQQCTFVDDPADADAVIVNTCTVIGATERKVLREIRSLRHHPLYVTGCMALVRKDAVFSVCQAKIIHPDEIRAAYREAGTVPRRSPGIVQACHGCLGCCSYCITRKARGRLISHRMEEIAGEIRALAGNGAAEIQLTGQDLSAWGADIGSDLGQLLSEINSIPGNFMIRVGMMNPATLYPVLDSVGSAFKGEKIFSLIHVPVQSGSDAVLGRMKRGYTCDQVTDLVQRFRTFIPDVSLHTDVICGYPGETEGDFVKTLALLSRIQPDKVNITRFSPRPGTPASLEKDMPDRFKKERSRTLRIHAEAIARQKNASLLGKEVTVTITEHPREGSSIGRTSNYTGVVIPGYLKPGTVRNVRLVEDRIYYFLGELG